MGRNKRKLSSSSLAEDHGTDDKKAKRTRNAAARNLSEEHSTDVKYNDYIGWVPNAVNGKAEGWTILDSPSQLQAQNFWTAHVAQRRPAVIPSALASSHCPWPATDTWLDDSLRNSAVSLSYVSCLQTWTDLCLLG